MRLIKVGQDSEMKIMRKIIVIFLEKNLLVQRLMRHQYLIKIITKPRRSLIFKYFTHQKPLPKHSLYYLDFSKFPKQWRLLYFLW